MGIAAEMASHERRKDRRHRYERYVFYATAKHFYQGNLKDYSKGGLRIESSTALPVGAIITVALPYVDEKNDKRQAQVVWNNASVFGVEFFKPERNRSDIRPVKS